MNDLAAYLRAMNLNWGMVVLRVEEWSPPNAPIIKVRYEDSDLAHQAFIDKALSLPGLVLRAVDGPGRWQFAGFAYLPDYISASRAWKDFLEGTREGLSCKPFPGTTEALREGMRLVLELPEDKPEPSP